LLYRRVRGCGPSEGLQSLPAVQDRPVLRRRVSETRLECRWAQGNVWHDRSSQSAQQVRVCFRERVVLLFETTKQCILTVKKGRRRRGPRPPVSAHAYRMRIVSCHVSLFRKSSSVSSSRVAPLLSGKNSSVVNIMAHGSAVKIICFQTRQNTLRMRARATGPSASRRGASDAAATLTDLEVLFLLLMNMYA